MKSLVGKVAVVTGASFGIGEAIVRTLAKNGMIVVGLARNIDKLNKIASTVTEGRICVLECDMRNEGNILEVFRKIENLFGGTDVLINNAGYLNFSPMIEGQTDIWRNVLETNVLGLAICTREALKTMRLRGDDGYIFHLNSIVGHFIHKQDKAIGMYPASKFSVTALAQTHRIELRNSGSKIKITSLSPGLVYTQMGTGVVSHILKESDEFGVKKEVPQGYLEPQDVADSIMTILNLSDHVEVQEFIVQSNTYAI